LERLQDGACAATSPQGLLELAGTLKACALFWADLLEEEEKLRRWLDRLKHQLNAFNQERLKAYCPAELLERANDWIRGIPPRPQPTHARQLKEAEELLQSLEKQARRRVAEKVCQQVSVLAQNKHSLPDPAEAETLLAEIDNSGHERHLPFDLRRRLEAAITATRSRHG